MLQTTRTPLPTGQPQRRGRVAIAALRLAQIVLAVQFAAAGTLKLAGNPAMVDMFATIGAGQWLRYLIGVLELAGAVGVLLRQLRGPAALGLAALMLGATVTNVAVLDQPPWLPLLLLALSTCVAVAHRAETTALFASFRMRQRHG